jgi:periplasmic protein TonB
METTLDDIVFANRNRAYGAYQLRKMQPIALQKAVVGGAAIFLSIFLIPTLVSKLWPKPAENQIIVCELTPTVLDKAPDEPMQKQLPQPKPPQATMRYVVPTVVTETKVQEVMAEVTELEIAQPAQDTQAGTASDLPVIELPKIEDKPIEKVIEAADPNEIVIAEVQPAFEGGMAAFARFLQKNLRYPSAASRAGVQGRVFMQFVVETDGQVSNANVLKGIGFGCDEEALRVLKLMPRWQPGLQAGRPVRTRFNVPIAFVLD